MATLLGAEFHHHATPPTRSTPPPPGQFFRIVTLGPTMVTRSGERGTPGDVEVRHFDTTNEAYTATTARITTTLVNPDLVERVRVYDVVPDAVAYGTPGTPHSPVDPEALFLDAWATSVFAPADPNSPTTQPRWFLISGALAERDRDTSVHALLAELESYPHAVAAGADRVIGRLPCMPRLHPNSTTFHPVLTTLDTLYRGLTVTTVGDVACSCVHACPACVPCSQRMADLLMFLCSGNNLYGRPWDDRARVTDVAYRLVRAKATPAIAAAGAPQ